MGFRFRRSVKILPGVRVNVGLKGTSLTAGARGASINVGKRGVHANAGIAGTGISFRERIGGTSSRSRTKTRQPESGDAEETSFAVTLSLKDNGAITAARDGEPLASAEMRLLWDQHGESVRHWLLDQAADINGDVDNLSGIYRDTPNPAQAPEYEEISFQEPPPPAPGDIALPEKPIAPGRARVPLSARLLKGKKEKFDREQLDRKQAYEDELGRWGVMIRGLQIKDDATKAKWKQERTEWMKRFKSHKLAEEHRRINFNSLIQTDAPTMQVSFDSKLQQIEWPRETLIDYEIASGGRTIWVDVDLPEIEDLPGRVATLAASGKKLNIKNKAQKQLRLEYATHIHGIAFRIAGIAFSTLPAAAEVVVSGYSQRLDAGTGIENDDYLISAKYTRVGFEEIDFTALDKVDPIAALERFDHRRKMTATGIFKPVAPFSP